jgi:hypothetical protein
VEEEDFFNRQVKVAADGDLLVPFGEYGAERLER